MNTSTPSSPAVSGAGPHHPDDPGEIMNIARPRRAPVSGRCLVTYWALACALLLLSACGGGGGGEGDSANDEMPVVATASIGNAGGAVASADGAITLTIPAGALSDEQRITVSAVNVRSLPPEFADLPAANIGKVYELQPDGLRFDKPIVIRIALNADPDLGFAPGNLLTSSGSVVEALDKQQIIVDADSGTVVLQGELSHFSPLVHNLFGGLKIRALWPKPRFTYPVQQDIPVTLEFEANARNKLFRVGADFLYTDQSQSPLAMVASGTDKDGRPILNKDDKGRPILETRFSADNLSDEAKPEAFSRHRLVYRCDEISEKVPYQAELALSNIALTPLDRSTPEDRAFIDQVGKFLAFASPKVTFKQAVNCVGRPFTVGGNVSGLDGTVTLQMRTGAGDAETLSIGQNGPFVFKQTVGDGLSWTVAVTAQPDNQVCSASPTGGRIAGVDVTNVAVVCEDRAKYRIGGDIGGLGGGTSVGLKLTAEDGTTSTIVASVNGFFYFDKMVATGTGYQVAITQQPTDQACRVENASGVVEDTDVNNVKVSCFVDTYTIGGTLTGLKNTESVDLALSTDSFVSRTENLLLRQNGPFVFSTKYPIVEGDGYIVYVALQPPTQKCTVSNGEGTVQNANVDNVVVTCIDRLGDGTWTTGLIGGDADPIGGHSLDFWVDLMIKTGSTQTQILDQNGAVRGAFSLSVHTKVLALYDGAGNRAAVAGSPNLELITITGSGNSVSVGDPEILRAGETADLQPLPGGNGSRFCVLAADRSLDCWESGGAGASNWDIIPGLAVPSDWASACTLGSMKGLGAAGGHALVLTAVGQLCHGAIDAATTASLVTDLGDGGTFQDLTCAVDTNSGTAPVCMALQDGSSAFSDPQTAHILLWPDPAQAPSVAGTVTLGLGFKGDIAARMMDSNTACFAHASSLDDKMREICVNVTDGSVLSQTSADIPGCFGDYAAYVNDSQVAASCDAGIWILNRSSLN